MFHRRDFKERNEPLRLLKTTRGRRLISSTEASLRPELKIRSKLVGLLNKRVARIGVPALRAVTQSERIGAVQRVISGVCVDSCRRRIPAVGMANSPNRINGLAASLRNAPTPSAGKFP